ncbi:helix-turn-helix domain-containing protein [Rhodococcus maanshanensis]|uniref:helix-turn-helix domain-containing protein n=1 Tax=Rhodococcus maanshanensis TaxID=183556 RepID=UPI003CCFF555
MMTKYADSHTREAWPSRATLAQGLGLSRPASVDQYVKELEAAGLIKVQARWKDRDGNHSFEKSATHKERGSSLYSAQGVVRQTAQG